MLWKRFYLQRFRLPPESMGRSYHVRMVQKRPQRPSIGTFLCLRWGRILDIASWRRAKPLSRCDIIPSRAAIWYSPEYNLHLSGIAAGVLVDEGKLSFQALEPNRTLFPHQQTWSLLISNAGPVEYPVNIADSDPIIGGAQAFFLALTASVSNVLHMFDQTVSFFVNIKEPSWSNLFPKGPSKRSRHLRAAASHHCPSPEPFGWLDMVIRAT